MTTAAEIRSLVKPLLASHPDLALAGPLVVIRPARHIVRGVMICRTSDAVKFRPTWAVSFIFEKRPTLGLNWGHQLHPDYGGSWRLDNPATQAALKRQIEKTALPLLRPVETIHAFIDFTEREFPQTAPRFYKSKQVLLDVALGNLDSARAICADMASKREMWMRSLLREDFTRIMDELHPLLLADDRPALAQLLHEWEAQTAKALKLEGIWEPSPFPLEQAGGGTFAPPSPCSPPQCIGPEPFPVTRTPPASMTGRS